MIKSFLNEQKDKSRYVSHHIDSFNDFVARRIQSIIDELGEIKIDLPTQESLTIKLGKVLIEAPQIRESDGATKSILPMEARLRNLTYSSPLYVEMTPVFEDVEHETTFVNIGEFPIMVKSDLCPLSSMSRTELIAAGEDSHDMGGYFIINGIERVLILSEEIATNKLIIQKKVEEITARLDSKNRGYTQRHAFERKEDGSVVVKFANLTSTPINLIILMKALGLGTDKDVMTAISRDGNINEATYLHLLIVDVTSSDDAINHIGHLMKISQKEQIESRVMNILDNYLLPHIGQTAASRIDKALFLGKVINKLELLKSGKLNDDDIDHYSNKRLRLSGDLLESILRAILLGRWGLIARLQYNYQKMIKRGRKLPNLQSIVITGVLTKQILRAMAVGNFANQTGVSQRLERSNFVRAQEHLRAVVSPLSSTQEHYEARSLHSTHWGRLDAVRTPEGQNIGLRKFLALGAQVTTTPKADDDLKIESALKSLGVLKEL
ncbi:MAG: DNA-directed RNA polymerase subunit B'' [DPANN group archaeon]|nr:DNA-directed RNA polymerase subunit B'' [DPANN group archaeon]